MAPSQSSDSAQSATLAAAARSAATAEERVIDLRNQLARVKEIVRAELDEETDLLRQRIAELGAELTQSREKAAHFEGMARAVYTSTSWRLTAPLRFMVLALRRLF